jgi:hypothetical protein
MKLLETKNLAAFHCLRLYENGCSVEIGESILFNKSRFAVALRLGHLSPIIELFGHDEYEQAKNLFDNLTQFLDCAYQINV